MFKRHSVALIVGLCSIASIGAAASQTTAPTTTAPRMSMAHNDAAATLKQDMRKLWTDHTVWTRDYIIAAVGDQPDATAAATRLLKNQEDIGATIASYYGKPAGDKLTALLKEHITIAVDVIKFAKAGDKAAHQQADAKWKKNADDIADFLAKANPNWPKATIVEMMNKHLSTTTDEVVA